MAINKIFIGLLIFGFVFFGGCVAVNLNNDEKTTQANNTNSPEMWSNIVDTTYSLRASEGMAGMNKINIPLNPNTAYRLNVHGEKRFAMIITTEELSPGNYGATVLGTRIVAYNEIVKTKAEEKSLEIEWNFEPSEIGSYNNIAVKLERFNGDPNIFPNTTWAPALNEV
jgi:hypothetical protein